MKVLFVSLLLSSSVLLFVLLNDSVVKKRLFRKQLSTRLPGIFSDSAKDTTKEVSENKVKLRLVENPGNGDCLFWCFKQALHTRDQNVSILQLRAVAAKSIDQNTFLLLYSIFENAKLDKDTKLQNEFSYMRDTHSLQDLQEKMMLNTYWGDEFALVSLERFAGVHAYVIKDGTLQSRPGVVRSHNAILLNLCDEHYRLYMSDTGKAIFKTKP